MWNTTRSACKPNSTARMRIRASLVGLPCFTCGHAVCWSSRTPEKSAHSATMGHVEAASLITTGGGYIAGNVGAQCFTCNDDARRMGRMDLTAYVIRGTVPTVWLSARDMRDMGDGADVRDARPIPTRQRTTAASRRASRFALWGW